MFDNRNISIFIYISFYMLQMFYVGVWRKTIQQMTNIPTQQLTKLLKSMEGKKFIKLVRSVNVSMPFSFTDITVFVLTFHVLYSSYKYLILHETHTLIIMLL